MLGLYPRRTAGFGTHFLPEGVLKEFPFPIQRLQSDRGGEFFGLPFQLALHDHRIKFRPIRLYSPHLNGKVERSQLTDKVEFYATADVRAPDLSERLRAWQDFYNYVRPHGRLGGRTPHERVDELAEQTPSQDEVWSVYHEEDEPYREGGGLTSLWQPHG